MIQAQQDEGHQFQHARITLEISRELLKSVRCGLFSLGYNFEKCSVSKIFLNCNERPKEMYTLKDFTKRLSGPNEKTLQLIYNILDNEGLLTNTNFRFEN